MKNRSLILLLTLTGILLFATGVAMAQSEERGQVRGFVYEDVNGDGVCVNTGVAGEDPVEGVPLEFVSSDEATVISLMTGDDGSYGLVAAGQSIWRVTVKPDLAEWTVTSENPLYAPVLPESGLIQTDINFCVFRGGVATGDAVIILPESGASRTANGNPILLTLLLLGTTFIGAGVVMELRRRQTV